MVKNNNVFHRRLDKELPLAVKAEGVWIEDEKGKRYLDGSGGAIVVNVGHGRKEIAEAVHNQILKCYYAHPTMFTNQPVEELANGLAKHAPKGIDRFYFLSGGGEAIEAAIKMARQIHLEYGRAERFRLIARWKSYHGLSLGALSAMGRTLFREPFAPLLIDVTHIHPPYCLRCSYGLKYPDCGIQCAKALEETILNLGPETVSAFLAETVSGATLAAYPPPKEYWPIIREICDKYKVLLIHDEVMCGLGRTGRWFASEHYNVSPDIVVMGKGLGGGVIPLSAVGVKSEYYDAIKNGKRKMFIHGGTYSHHAVAAAAGVTVMKILEKEALVERVDHYGKIIGKTLHERLDEIPYVGDIRGIGFMWGVEIVKDKKTLSPFPRKEKVIEKISDHLFKQGVLLYKSTGLAGIDGDGIMVGPPFIIKKDEIDIIANALYKAIMETLVDHP